MKEERRGRKKPENSLRHRMELERLILGIATRFINIQPEGTDAALNQALEDLGRFAGMDRAYLFRLDGRRDRAFNTHEWCAEGVEPHIQRLRLQGLALADFAPLAERLLRGEIVSFARTPDLSPLSAAGREEFERAGIRSLLLVPMSLDGVVKGFLGFTAVSTERTMPKEILELLQIACTAFAGALERQRIDGALREKTEELETYFNFALDLFCIADTDGHFRRLNREWERMLGYRLDELEGRKFLDLVHPEDLQATQDAVAMLAEQKEVRNFTNRYRCKDGSYRWIEWRSYPSGKRIFAAARDITERRQTEESLQILAELLDASPACVVVYDMKGKALYANEKTFSLHRCTREEFLALRVKDLYPPEGVPLIASRMKEIVERGEGSYEITHRRKDGTLLPLLLNSRVAQWGDRQVILSVATDLTERRQTEESLQILAELLDASPACVVVYDMKGKALYANEKTFSLHGMTREEFFSLRLKDLHTPESARLIASRLKGILEHGEGSYEVTHRRKDGSPLPLLVNSKVGLWGDRQVIMSVASDLTERKDEETKRLELERQLLHTQRLESLGVLAGGIAHDFNNLLMAIVGNLDVLLMTLPPESPLRNGIEQALKASRRAADLTRQMLAYSGKGRFVVKPLDLGELVRENAHLLRTAISRTITIDLVTAAGLPMIEADPGQVQQVVMNLIINASEAIGEQSGQVRISTGVRDCDEADLRSSRCGEKPPPGKFVYLEVSDTGCGMDEQTQQHIFDPFFSTKFVGRGLGMPAVLGIVRGHGGAIFMESAPGKGTTIRVLFPAKEIRKEGTVRESPRPAATFSGTVLVVDDDEIVRSVCLDLLHHLGFSTIGAKDGDEALAIFGERADEISCVILDLTMPRRDGVGTFQEMKRKRPDVKVILCSGYSEQESLRRFAGEGLAGFLQKPYQIGELKDRIESVLKPAP